MTVDVSTEIVIQRPREVVASYAADPDNAPEWYVNIKAVEWKSQPPLRAGSTLAFVAQFMGRRLEYTYVVGELIPGARLVMRTPDGPFPMETSYLWEDAAEGGTRMVLRNRGDPAGLFGLLTPLLASAMRRANRKDLDRLRTILEERA